MRLIVLTGDENCGKTKSLNRLADIIQGNGGKCHHKDQLGNPKKNDWEYGFTIQNSGKKTRLAVSTWGDYWWTLDECCKKFHDYDVVVCACNLRFMHGKTHKPFEDAMKYDSLATVVMKSCETDKDRQDAANDQCSDYIFGLIRHLGII